MPAPWTRTIEELCADGVRGDVYAHELVTVEPGTAADLLERARDASELHARHGWELFGAFTTAMVNDDEALLLWAIPTWQQWADGEGDRELAQWRRGLDARTLAPRRDGRRAAGPVADRPAAVAFRPHRLARLTHRELETRWHRRTRRLPTRSTCRGS